MLLLPIAVGYLVLARTLRYRRISQLQAQHGSTAVRFANLDYKDAQKIIGQMGLYEFPWIFLAGKDFAFLRVSDVFCFDSLSHNRGNLSTRTKDSWVATVAG